MNHDTIILPCPHCGTKNRLPRNRMHERPVCGRCRTVLPAVPFYDHPVIVNDRTFEAEVVQYPGVVVVDCWAPWCGHCRTVGPTLDQLALEYAGRVKIVKLNVDENPATASQFAIQGIPTLLLFKNGKQVDRLVGAQPKLEIAQQLNIFL